MLQMAVPLRGFDRTRLGPLEILCLPGVGGSAFRMLSLMGAHPLLFAPFRTLPPALSLSISLELCFCDSATV